MIIQFNQTPLELPEPMNLQMNLQTLLIQQGYTHAGFAVMHNHIFIPRSAYAETWVQNGDSLDIILPMQGG